MAKRTRTRKVKADTPAPGLLNSLTLTDLDRKIIRHLQQDGRRTFVAIANDIGVTEKTVRAHARALLDQQIIQITALTSPAALGYSVSALAAISIDSPAAGTRIADALARIETIDYVVLTYSRYAIFAEIIARDLPELQTTIETRIGTIQGIIGIELFPYFSLHYQQAHIMDTGPARSGGVRDAELSDIDKAIAAELNIDGRISFATVGGNLGISENQVRQRVQSMLSAREINIMAILNPLKLLNFTMAWVAIKISAPTRLTDVADALSMLPSVSYVAICAGRFDIFVEVVCTSQAELLEILETHIRTVDGIRETEVFIYANLHYKRLLPVHAKDRSRPSDNDRVHSIYEP
ncbi:MAG: Lrp/AsnC family transcriptional regulator [Alphaproteobacteria bacterium]|nr:Lrp/AsnC family transcriptional regulator [Alphaproteobacteria bacterium]